jgi:hypothetical protein
MCGNGLGIESGSGSVLDGKAITAENQNGLYAIPLAQATHDVVQAGHQRSVSMEKGPGTYESPFGKSSKKS